MTTDTTALQERIARAIHSDTCEESLSDCLDPGWPGRCMRSAEATLPIIAAEVQAAKAEAFEEGWKERAKRDMYRSRTFLHESPDAPAPPPSLNPYRATHYPEETP